MLKKLFTKDYSLRRLIVLIVLGAMCLLLLMQTISLNFFLQRNDRKRQDYINGIVNATSVSLAAIGQNIEAMGSYISSYRAFQELYIDRSGDANAYVDAYQTVRFMTTYMPVIKDLIVVDLNSIPMSYYSPEGYDVVDLVGEQYSFTDRAETRRSFFFWEDQNFFAYVVPIQKIYSSTPNLEKQATAILVCDLEHIRALLNQENEIAMAFFDCSGQVVAYSGRMPTANAGKSAYVEAVAEPMGLLVRTSGSTTFGEDVYWLLRWFFIVSIGVIVLCMMFALLMLNKGVVQPVTHLVSTITTPAQPNLKQRIPQINIREINTIVDSFNQILDKNDAVTKQIFATQNRLYESELRKTESEVYALQSQINPHFLYNTLQCIRSLAILNGSSEIADISLAMSELFRYSIEPGDTVTLEKELEIVRKYELITRVRYQGRFSFHYQIDEALLQSHISKMLVQPLIENAIFHGLSKREEDGSIYVHAWMEEETLCLSVSDDGPDPDEQYLDEINRMVRQEPGEGKASKCLGLRNIHRRLYLRYGEPYGLSIQRKEKLTVVTIRCPFNQAKG